MSFKLIRSVIYKLGGQGKLGYVVGGLGSGKKFDRPTTAFISKNKVKGPKITK